MKESSKSSNQGMDRMAQRIAAAYESMPERGQPVNSHYVADKLEYLKRLNRAQAYAEVHALDEENLDFVVQGFVKDGCTLSPTAIKFILQNFWALDTRC